MQSINHALHSYLLCRPYPTTNVVTSEAYIGRFAPSPTGPLHLGSLMAALASFLDARHAGGQWLVRMENLDPPREQPGAAKQILQQLEQHNLHWDAEVVFQSSRHSAYLETLKQLHNANLAYGCLCSRQQIKAMGSIYNGHCRTLNLLGPEVAIRIDTHAAKNERLIQFEDIFQGHQQWDIPKQCGDFIIRRRDSLFAYQLACAVDDYQQGITHIIRGSDLLDSTPRQLYVMRLMQTLDTTGHAPPCYGHIPVASNPNGQKLSKQNLAPAIDAKKSRHNLTQALELLNQQPPKELAGSCNQTILDWAIAHWRRDLIPNSLSVEVPIQEA